MNCSPLQLPARTIIPTAIRNWLGARLSGPRGDERLRRYQACLYVLGRIGDFVLALSALRLLIRKFGSDGCVLVVPESAFGIAAREFPGVRCIALPAEAASLIRGILPAWWRERRKFSEDRFQQLVCLSHQRSLYYEVSLSWIDAEKDMRLRPETYPTVASDGLCTELLAHWHLVETVLGHPVSREDILPSFSSIPTNDDGRLLVYPLARDALRHLPVEKVIGVLRLWRERSQAPISFGGSPAEAPALTEYLAAAKQAGLAGITMELPVGVDGFFEHIARAGALLASESAAAHIAIAFNKPTVVMMGGGVYGYCQPWRSSDRQTTVQYPMPCFGCGWHCPRTEMVCMTRLPVAPAAAALPAL